MNNTQLQNNIDFLTYGKKAIEYYNQSDKKANTAGHLTIYALVIALEKQAQLTTHVHLADYFKLDTSERKALTHYFQTVGREVFGLRDDEINGAFKARLKRALPSALYIHNKGGLSVIDWHEKTNTLRLLGDVLTPNDDTTSGLIVPVKSLKSLHNVAYKALGLSSTQESTTSTDKAVTTTEQITGNGTDTVTLPLVDTMLDIAQTLQDIDASTMTSDELEACSTLLKVLTDKAQERNTVVAKAA